MAILISVRLASSSGRDYGRTHVDEQGRYRFRTIRLVPYPVRTPHIHFAVHVPGRLVTQMYIWGEPLNAWDGILKPAAV